MFRIDEEREIDCSLQQFNPPHKRVLSSVIQLGVQEGYITYLMPLKPTAMSVIGYPLSYGSVTDGGSVLLWNYETNQCLFKLDPKLGKLTWADLIIQTPLSDPTLLVYSEGDGVYRSNSRMFSIFTKYRFPRPVPETYCKPTIVNEFDIVCATGVNSCIVVPNSTDRFACLLKTTDIVPVSAAPLFILPITDSEDDIFRLVVVGTLDCRLSIVRSTVTTRGNTETGITVASCLLTKTVITENEITGTVTTDEPCIPICCDGDPETGYFTVGTAQGDLFLVKWSTLDNTISIVKTIFLPTSHGITCLKLRPDSKLLAIGCADGRIRIVTFPNLNRLTVLALHRQPISSMIFLVQAMRRPGLPNRKYILICASMDRKLTSWDVCNY